MRQLASSFTLSVTLLLAACGSEEPTIELDEDVADFTEGNPVACDQVTDTATTLRAFPAAFSGSLDLSSSFVSVAEGSCSTEEAPYGIDTPGPDEVIELADLVPGTEYMVRLNSKADLAMYITQGCVAQQEGAVAAGCMLFSDASVASIERGAFIAPENGRAFVVVDYFLAATPLYGDFNIEVYEAECSGDDECSTGNCVDQRCVECVSNFDCGDSAAPVCDTTSNTCVAGESQCNAEGASEGSDDGPAGALDITPGDENLSVTPSAVCNYPDNEVDYFKFEAVAGEHFSITLDWEGTADLELMLYDAEGRVLGASLWQQPERIDLTYLPAGSYYAVVDYYSTAALSDAQAYELSVERVGADSCESAADCAAEFETQIYRGNCNAGACSFMDEDGAGEIGDACDSNDDCGSGACSTFTFTADADSRSVCAASCETTADCGEGFFCADYLVEPICVPTCESDLQCAVSLGSQPTEGAWQHLTCGEDGACSF